MKLVRSMRVTLGFNRIRVGLKRCPVGGIVLDPFSFNRIRVGLKLEPLTGIKNRLDVLIESEWD